MSIILIDKKNIFGYFNFSKYKLAVEGWKPALKLVKGVSISGRQKGGVRIRRLWGDVEYARRHTKGFLYQSSLCINLDFLEEPSEKPTTDLSWTQLDDKASIR